MTTPSNTKISIQSSAPQKPSALAKFSLSFEYDRSWSDAKQTVQHRPTKR